MSFFISNAWAEGAAGAGAGAPPESGLMGFIPLILIFVLFYFLLIRPQAKRAKEHKQMVETLAKGDEVVTNGGVLGRITEVGDSFISVEIAEGIVVKVQRNAVASLVPKGTFKSTD
ncbi:MAG: preprotein translocase subunit YajC [Gammaproteobacteria bacterium]|nr:preprotein translocase subunit YajC [Gammaproteobacteria bacterium]